MPFSSRTSAAAVRYEPFRHRSMIRRPSSQSRKPSLPSMPIRRGPLSGPRSEPVQRTEYQSVARPGAGGRKVQWKSTFGSTRRDAGSPARSGLAKYSPLRPRSFAPPPHLLQNARRLHARGPQVIRTDHAQPFRLDSAAALGVTDGRARRRGPFPDGVEHGDLAAARPAVAAEPGLDGVGADHGDRSQPPCERQGRGPRS